MKFGLALWLAGATICAAADDPNLSLCEAPVTETARKYLGTPYVRAGEDPARGFDCSGFTKYVFAQSCGYQLPRSSSGQSRAGVKVAREQLQPGDLVVFREPRRLHMGLYLGEGRFIHSPNRRGAVRVESLESQHYRRAFREGRRVLEPVDLTGIFQMAREVDVPPPSMEAASEPKLASVKKTSVRKTSARKKSARKIPSGKTAVKKAPAKKAPGKKSPARKTPAKTAPAKKAPVKKTSAAKPPAPARTPARPTTAPR